MKIDFNQPMKALNGEDRKDRTGDIFRLRDACVVALDSLEQNAMGQVTEHIDGKEKYRRGELATRIYGAKEPIRLTAEEITLVKERVAKIQPSSVLVYEAWNLLDPKDAIPDPPAPTPTIPAGK